MSENNENEYDWKEDLDLRGRTTEDAWDFDSMSAEDVVKYFSEDEESEEGVEESSESDLPTPEGDEEENSQPESSVSGAPNFQKGAPQTAVKAYIANKGRSRKTRKYFPTKTRW